MKRVQRKREHKRPKVKGRKNPAFGSFMSESEMIDCAGRLALGNLIWPLVKPLFANSEIRLYTRDEPEILGAVVEGSDYREEGEYECCR